MLLPSQTICVIVTMDHTNITACLQENKKENKNFKKRVKIYQNCTMMVTVLSAQNKELASKDLPVRKTAKIVNFETYLLVIFLVFHQLPCHENMALPLNDNYLKNLGFVYRQTSHYFFNNTPK